MDFPVDFENTVIVGRKLLQNFCPNGQVREVVLNTINVMLEARLRNLAGDEENAKLLLGTALVSFRTAFPGDTNARWAIIQGFCEQVVRLAESFDEHNKLHIDFVCHANTESTTGVKKLLLSYIDTLHPDVMRTFNEDQAEAKRRKVENRLENLSCVYGVYWFSTTIGYVVWCVPNYGWWTLLLGPGAFIPVLGDMFAVGSILDKVSIYEQQSEVRHERRRISSEYDLYYGGWQSTPSTPQIDVISLTILIIIIIMAILRSIGSIFFFRWINDEEKRKQRVLEYEQKRKQREAKQ